MGSINSVKSLIELHLKDRYDEESEDEERYMRVPRQKNLLKKSSNLTNSNSLRDLADMEDYLKEKHGDNYTTEVN